MNRPAEKLIDLARIILEPGRPAYSLRPEVIEMAEILAAAGMLRQSPERDISAGESRTSNGQAISPAMAAMCVDDYVRTIAFVRGTHAAIADVRSRFPGRPARVLYAGCGPYAALALPSMALLSPDEVGFTLLDIHPESIASASAVIEMLGLAGSVTARETLDAASYRIDPARPPDIILVEMMQACLESEPQVAIARHLLPQAPDAILVPEEVRIDLELVDPGKEFALADADANAEQTRRDHIPVGPVFVVDREAIGAWEHIAADSLPGLKVRIPGRVEPRYQPMLFTRIRVYRQHRLGHYDSGLTCPRVLPIDRGLKSGTTIRFDYELGPHPRLRNQIVDR